MMLSTLTDIAIQKDLNFLYGEKQAFNILADHTNPRQVIMYHEGYVSGTASEDAQGAWDRTYNLRIWLLLPNTGLNEMPIDRLPRFEQLEPLMYELLSMVSASGYDIIGTVSFSEGINQTDSNLDGLRFVANVRAKEPVIYCQS